MRIEITILRNLLKNEDFARKVLPFIKTEYFQDRSEKILFEHIHQFFTTYNALPTTEALVIDIDGDSSVNEDEFGRVGGILDEIIEETEDVDPKWLEMTTETFCKDKALFNGIMESIAIIEGESKEPKTSIASLLSDALAVNFDRSIGHDFLEDFSQRYEFYHTVEERIPFDIEFLNKITKGGLPNKSLTMFLAGTGVGKTMIMCHMATANLTLGKNVLYITLELAEERIAERIDANLLNVELDDLESLPKQLYDKKIATVKAATDGKLIIKEYPGTSAGAGHFRHLLNELALKKKFVPDIIYIDYINNCASMRLKMGGAVNTYSYVKAIVEEIRGLAMEMKLPIVSATQTNRGGQSNSDLEIEDVSESHGTSMTVDLLIAVITNEELAALNQFLFKQLKNRFRDVNVDRRFMVGVDRAKMRLYDVEQTAQEDIMDGPVMDKTEFGERHDNDFSGFKV
tara:strand:- start:1719 stop:3092 length:1374 start_codon:yes stop_codon:yes gene_type:complete